VFHVIVSSTMFHLSPSSMLNFNKLVCLNMEGRLLKKVIFIDKRSNLTKYVPSACGCLKLTVNLSILKYVYKHLVEISNREGVVGDFGNMI
jgi:hypothetical protein